MNPDQPQNRMKRLVCLFVASILLAAAGPDLAAQNADKDVAKKLLGFDAYMTKILKDWNAPGIGVGIVVGDKLVFAKGYGYRDYGKKLPYTPLTLHQIASNTKLFTAVAAGLLVDEGKLTWDKPVRESVPTINFYNDQLNTTVTLRDMLAHRTGITRHDTIWFKSDLSRKELFDRIKYLEPERAPSPDVPLQQPDVRRRRLHDRAPIGQDLGGLRPRADLRTPEDDEHDLFRRGHAQATRARRALLREAGFLRALPDPLLRGYRRGRPVRGDHLQHPGHVALADRPDERREVRGPAGHPV